MLYTWAQYNESILSGGIYDAQINRLPDGPHIETQSWSRRESLLESWTKEERSERLTAIKTPPPLKHPVLKGSLSFRYVWYKIGLKTRHQKSSLSQVSTMTYTSYS